MALIIIWIALCFIPAIIAERKGRSGVGFFVFAFLLSPIVATVFAVVMNGNQDVVDQAAIQSGDSRKCPFCAEIVRAEALVCRFCGRELPTLSYHRRGRADPMLRAEPADQEVFTKPLDRFGNFLAVILLIGAAIFVALHWDQIRKGLEVRHPATSANASSAAAKTVAPVAPSPVQFRAAKAIPDPNISTVQEVETDMPSFIDRPFFLQGSITVSSYYNFAFSEGESRFYSFEIRDGTGTAYGYAPRENGVALRQAILRAGQPLHGIFQMKIPRIAYQPGQMQLLSGLVGWRLSDSN